MAFIPKIPELTKEELEFIAQIDRPSCHWAGRGKKTRRRDGGQDVLTFKND
jgi:hypothetical protein